MNGFQYLSFFSLNWLILRSYEGFFFSFWIHSRPVSGGSLNPARSLGPAIVAWDFKDIWVYITAPTIGAVAGALVFHLLRIRPRPCSADSSPDDGLLVHSIAFSDQT